MDTHGWPLALSPGILIRENIESKSKNLIFRIVGIESKPPGIDSKAKGIESKSKGIGSRSKGIKSKSTNLHVFICFSSIFVPLSIFDKKAFAECMGRMRPSWG